MRFDFCLQDQQLMISNDRSTYYIISTLSYRSS